MSKKTQSEVFSKKLVGKSVNGKLLCATECGFKKKNHLQDLWYCSCVLYSSFKRKLANFLRISFTGVFF